MSNTPHCSRCDRRFRPSLADAHAWNGIFQQGVITGYLCPDCQSPEENAEAEINLATLDYTRDELGRGVGVPRTDAD